MVERCILLLLASNSVDVVDTRATDQIREIDNAIQSATHRDSFERLHHSCLRVSDITKLLLRHEPHILHISGHSRAIEGLLLEDDDSKIAKIEYAQLVDLILSSTDDARLRLAFFSFCHSEECATAISAKVPYAIGVRDEITVDSLILFSHAFYEALASGRSVRVAFANAQERLKTKGLGGSDAMVLRVRSGTSAEVPFLGSMEFFKKSVDEALGLRPSQFYSCFISYSHADRSFARRLHDSLQGRGIRCWLDEHALLPGDKIYTEVDRGIRLWDKVLLCCSKDALTSWWVDNEIKIAFDKEQQLWRDRKREVLALIPLNLDDYLFSGEWQSGLATEVKARLAAQFNGWEDDNKKFEEQFERLVKALRTDSEGKQPLPPMLL